MVESDYKYRCFRLARQGQLEVASLFEWIEYYGGRHIMKRFRNCILALLVGCSMPLVIWLGAGSALYQKRKQANLACSVDSDCPAGFVCDQGRCVPEKM